MVVDEIDDLPVLRGKVTEALPQSHPTSPSSASRLRGVGRILDRLRHFIVQFPLRFCAANRSRSWTRRRRRRSRTPRTPLTVTLEKKQKADVIRKCLGGLSSEHREIIDLVYYHEKSVEEVAEIVGIPENRQNAHVLRA